MSEPEFIYQTVEDFPDQDARVAWVDLRWAESKAHGATWGRVTVDPERGWCLVECWKVKPEDEGEPRWKIPE